jgi:hypothetical protein
MSRRRLAGALLAAGVLAGALGGCSSGASSGTAGAESLKAWANAAGLSQTSDLITRYLATIERDRVQGTPGEVKFDCLGLRGQAIEGNSYLPSPDATLSKLLAAAYGDYYGFAAACVSAGGASHNDPTTSHLALAGDRELGSALARYDTLTR